MTPPLYSAPSVAALLAYSADRSARRAGNQDLRSRPTVWLKGLGGTWQTVGADATRGRRPEQLTLTSDIGGPATGGFVVNRDALTNWPDMHPRVDCIIEVDGVPLWGGKVEDTPRGDSIQVQLRGHQARLDDDQIDAWYVHQDWAGWHDTQSRVVTYPTGQRGGTVSLDGAGAFAQFIMNATVPAGVACGVELDLGPGRTAKRFAALVETSNNSGWYVYVRGSTAPTLNAGTTEDIYANDLSTHGAGPTWRTGTFTTPMRYLQLFVYTTAGGTPAIDVWARFKQVLVFEDAAYESGNASALTAPTVFRDIRGRLSWLSTDESQIDPNGEATYIIDHLAPPGYSTPREVLQAAAGYHRWRWGVDAQRRLFFLPYPTAPAYMVGDWPGCDTDGLSPASSAEVYNRVIVEGQTPDGQTLRVTRSTPSPILDRLGETRWGKVTVGVPVGAESDLEFIGDAWLAERGRTPLRGSVRVTGHALRGVLTGPMHASRALLAPGERILVTNIIDPDGGGAGRSGTVTSVTYDDDAQAATITIDDDVTRLDYLLSRIGASVTT